MWNCCVPPADWWLLCCFHSTVPSTFCALCAWHLASFILSLVCCKHIFHAVYALSSVFAQTPFVRCCVSVFQWTHEWVNISPKCFCCTCTTKPVDFVKTQIHCCFWVTVTFLNCLLIYFVSLPCSLASWNRVQCFGLFLLLLCSTLLPPTNPTAITDPTVLLMLVHCWCMEDLEMSVWAFKHQYQ